MVFKTYALGVIAALITTGAAFADDAARLYPDWSAPLTTPITKDLKAACESKDPEALAYCHGALMGLYDSNLYIADIFDGHPLCIPETITGEQMRVAFLDLTKKQPDDIYGPISKFYYLAMNAAFPCPSQDPTPPKPDKTKK